MTVTDPAPPAAPTGGGVAARAVAAVKTYGIGDTMVKALDGVDLEITAGRFTAVMGPSGSGKSTLMHCMAGLDDLTSGQVLIGEVDLTQLKEKDLTVLRRDNVGFVFQGIQPGAHPHRRGEHPPAPVPRRAQPGPGLDGQGGRRPSDCPTASTTGPPSSPAASSSGWPWPGPSSGQPQLAFADEPTGNLDSNSGAEILRFMRSAVDDLGQTIVMVTHDPLAAAYSDRVVFLVDGKITEEMADPTQDKVIDKLKRLGG